LALGRLPVKSPAELAALVAKIVAYETDPGGLDWRSRAVFVADDADGAGDFAALSDAAAALLPAGIATQRIYYGPGEPSAINARTRTIAAFSAGAGLVTYTGHGGQYQWATTDPAAEQPYILGLYDGDGMTNGARLPVVLAMTCLTSAFQTPSYSGTSVDERLLLASGGAVAVWGPAGLGVSHGHDRLQRGFYQALWAAPPQQATLGSLVQAGYRDLFETGLCCQDAIRTYVLLGDPLTHARIVPAQRVFLPIIDH
jgi:hypothetical protein